MSAALVRYENARRALAEAHRVDEVKDIRDKAEAMAAYARQAKDQDLIKWATEIKVRAERRAGEMLQEMEKNTGTRVCGGVVVERSDRQRLTDIGISKDQSSRWQQLASMSEEHFEATVETAKNTAGEVTTAFMLRAARASTARPMKTKRAQKMREELNEAANRGVSLLSTYASQTLRTLRLQEVFTEQELQLLAELATAINHLTKANVR